jgi:hypothetical protein
MMLILGTDMINIALSYSLIQFLIILPSKAEGSDIDGWLYIRDIVCYSLGFVICLVFLFLKLNYWYFGIVMIGYYFFYFVI